MTVTSILSASALTTYARAKERLVTNGQNAINDAEHQNIIEGMINAVSDGVVRYCGREFHKISRVEQCEPPERERILVDVTPVATSPAPTATLDGAAVALTVEDAKLGFLRVLGGWGGKDYQEPVSNSVALATRPGTGERVAVVTYTGGWVTPGLEIVAGVTASAVSDAQTLTSPTTPTTTGSLVATVAENGETAADVTVTWAGASLVSETIQTSAMPATYDLGALDDELEGFSLEVDMGENGIASSVTYAVIGSDTAQARNLPWNIEEAVLIGTALLWRAMRGGYAKDVMPEMDPSGLPADVVPWLTPYRRNF